MNKAYSVLATVYERLAVDEVYAAWAARVTNILKERAKGVSGIDLACGSGYFTRAEKKAGFDVVGVDICEEMLTRAKEEAAKAHLNIAFLRQDMTCLKSFNKVDFLTCVNDGVNYLSPERLKKAFSAFKRQLRSGGVLYFDFSTEYKLKNVIGNNMFGEDYDDVTYVWFNKLFDDRVEMDLTLFTKSGDLYKKNEESHVQYMHKLDFIVAALKEAGFTSVEYCGFMGGKISETTERIEIIATA